LKVFGLLAVAVACAIAGFAAFRFDYELCHRGMPIAWLAVGLPIAGLVAGTMSFLLRRRGWVAVANILVAIANVNFLLRAVTVLTGPGYLTC
jgi:hypothetical protein